MFIISFVILFCGSICAQGGVRISTGEELMAYVKTGPCKNAERLEAVKKLFKEMGASDADIMVESFKDIQNVVVTKKGKTDDKVVVGAHYDKVWEGCGTVDNWTGIVILANLYRSMAGVTPEKTYIFVAFDQEELGLRGSEAMAKKIAKEDRPKYCSMVNLDSFGMGYPLIMENTSSPSMVKFAKEVADGLKLKINSAPIDGASSDSASFKGKDIPAITISALSAKWPEILHSSNDKIENVIGDSVRIGYIFSLQYLVKVDAGTCDQFRKK